MAQCLSTYRGIQIDRVTDKCHVVTIDDVHTQCRSEAIARRYIDGVMDSEEGVTLRQLAAFDADVADALSEEAREAYYDRYTSQER